MVEFTLINRTANRLVYEYYPKGDTEKLPGLISVWIKKRDVVLDVPAEDDFIMFSTSEELSKLRDSFEEIYKELDMIPEDDDEWESLVEDYDWYYYAEKVMDRLRSYMEQGKLCKDEEVIWYVV